MNLTLKHCYMYVKTYTNESMYSGVSVQKCFTGKRSKKFTRYGRGPVVLM